MGKKKKKRVQKTRFQRLFNRHCILTLGFFLFLLAVMYHSGEAKNAKAIFGEAIKAIAAATVDLYFSLVSDTG